MSRKKPRNRGSKTTSSYKAPSAVFQASPQGMAREALKEELAKTGATLSPNGMEKQADGGAYFSIPMPFQPEFGDPSKLHFPIDRHQQNRYWRLINKTDPVIGSVIDMFAEMLCSDIDLYGEGINGEVKRQYEEMIQSTQIISMFQYFIKEFLIIGEVIPHLVFDESKGIWTDLLFHNPDQVNVMSAPFMNMEPILDFIPDESLKNFVQSKNPQVLEYLSNLPEDILSSILSSNSIPLNTQMNVSFIPRKLHPYDVRGTSIMPRLWQIYMYESAIMNASIATARRHAGPIKVLKVGDPNGNWLPTETDLASMMEKLTMAEQDPHAWLTSHPFLNFEAWGTTDRMMSISREYDLIERVKLTALGVSQGFLHGECCILDTPVLTSDYTYKPIQDIEVGSKVIDKEGQPQVVTHAWESHTPETLTEIETVGGKTIVTTHNHKFPVWAWPRTCACGCGEEVVAGRSYKQRHKCRHTDKRGFVQVGAKATIGRHQSAGILEDYNPYQKLEASDIRKKDYLMMPRKFDMVMPKVSIAHARLLGYYISEGCYVPPVEKKTNFSQATFTFNSNEQDTWAKDVVNLAKRIGFDYKVSLYPNRDSICDVRFSRKESDALCGWLLFNGNRYSHSKKLSAEVMKWPLEYKKELIKGMFRGDGNQHLSIKKGKDGREHKQFTTQYTTISKDLAEQTQLVLGQLGIFARISKVKEAGKNRGGYNRKDCYILQAYASHGAALAKLVWDTDITLATNSRSQVWFDDDYMYLPIKSVKTIENEESLPTFNLTVDNDHSYIVDGLGTYNSTYASSDVNMNTLLMRLRGLRKFFEGVWWRPKFFKPIAEINDWYHSTPAEVSHRVKTKRTAHEQRLIIPKIKWRQSLEPVVDKDLLDAIRVLNDMGIKSSKGTAFAAAGLDFEGETTNNYVEQKIEKQIREKILPQEKEEHEKIEEEISLPGGGGAPLTPTAPEEGEGLDETSPSPEEGETGPDREQPTPETMEPAPASKRGFKISANDVEDLIDLMESGKTDSDIWNNLVGKKESPTKFRKNCDWVRILDYMEDEGYSNKEIEYTRKALVRKDIVEPELNDRIEAALDKVEQHALFGGEEQMGELLDKNIKKKIAKFTEATNKAAADTNADIDMLFAGEGNYKYSTNEFIVQKGGNMSKDKIDNYRKKKGGK